MDYPIPTRLKFGGIDRASNHNRKAFYPYPKDRAPTFHCYGRGTNYDNKCFR